MEDPKTLTSSFDKEPLIKRLGWFKRTRLGDSGERLNVSLEVFYREMKVLELKALDPDTGLRPEIVDDLQNLFSGIASLLERSAEALRAGNLELGWETYHAALRLETQIYYEMAQEKNSLQDFGRDRLRSRALNTLIEGSKKLMGWRLAMLNQLLADKGVLKKSLSLGDVVQAQQVLSEHHTNVYRRLKILRSQIQFLEVTATLAIIGWVSVLVFESFLEQFEAEVFSPTLTLSALTFGILGACISGILRLEKRSSQQRIPDQLTSLVYTVARPLVGAVSALAVVIFVLAGILDVGSETPGLYLAAAFAAGFSERLLTSGMEKFDAPKDGSTKNEGKA